MYFRAKVIINRFLNWLSPARGERRRAELRAMCEQLAVWLDSVSELPHDM